VVIAGGRTNSPTSTTTTTTMLVAADLSSYEPLAAAAAAAGGADSRGGLSTALGCLRLDPTPAETAARCAGPGGVSACGGVDAGSRAARRGANMTECVTVPSSEHVAEIVGRQGASTSAARLRCTHSPMGWAGLGGLLCVRLMHVSETSNGFEHFASVQIAVATLSGNSLRQTVHTHRASVHQAAKLVAALSRVGGSNCRPGGK